MIPSPNVLVTGANGFVGTALTRQLWKRPDVQCVGAVRDKRLADEYPARYVAVGEIDGNTDWSDALSGQSVVIHAAARAHIMKDASAELINEYRRVNLDGTVNLARQAIKSGVRRFIFISSIKVNGETTELNQPFNAEDNPAPQDDYGLSKWEAEQALKELVASSDMELVVLRPPMIYGPGVKGNFATLVKLVRKGWPMPFGSINNKRSLVGIDNLVDLIVTCINHPHAANQTFLASDGQDLSTTNLLRGVAEAVGSRSRLIPVPVSILSMAANLLGQKALAQRLFGSLQLDIKKTQSLLGWSPPVAVSEGLRRAVTVEQDG